MVDSIAPPGYPSLGTCRTSTEALEEVEGGFFGGVFHENLTRGMAMCFKGLVMKMTWDYQIPTETYLGVI